MINFDPFLEEYPIAKRKRLATPYNFLPYFFINGVAYNLPYGGATWEEWMHTRHNVNNFAVISELVYTNHVREDQALYNPVEGVYVLASDPIIPFTNYSIGVDSHGLFTEQRQVASWLTLRNQEAIAQDEAEPLDASYAIILDKDYEDGRVTGMDFIPDADINSPTNVINSYNVGATYSLRATARPHKLIMPSHFEKIGNNACKGMKGISEIRLPANLKQIGKSAFDYCDSLAHFSINEENEYYTTLDGVLYSKDMQTLIRCPSNFPLSTFIVPEQVTHIADSAFNGCQNLKQIVLTQVTHIGKGAIMSCPNLSEVIISDRIERVERKNFMNCPKLIFNRHVQNADAETYALYLGSETEPYRVLIGTEGSLMNKFTYTIPSGTRVIGTEAFKNWNTIRFMFFASNSQCVTIEGGAFSFLTQMQDTLTIPRSVRYIGEQAFFYDSALTKIYMDDKEITDAAGKVIGYEGVEFIGEQAFGMCTGLEEISFPRSIREIGADACYNCDSLITYTDEDGNGIYWGNVPNRIPYLVLCGVQDPTMPVTGGKELRAIYPSALQNTEITWLDLRGHTQDYAAIDNIFDKFNYLKIIPKGFLKDNNRIAGVILPNSVEIIGEEAFAHCVNLGILQVGPKLQKIGKNAFQNCQYLKNVRLNEKLDNRQVYKSWFGIEFENPEANPLHMGAELEQKFYGKHPTGDYYIRVETYSFLNINDGVEEIKDYAFLGCSSLISLRLENASNLKRIGKRAFSNCKHLGGGITIPSSIETIATDDPFADTEITKFENYSRKYAYEEESGTLFDIYWFNQIHSISHPITDVQIFSHGIDADGNNIVQFRLPLAFPLPGGKFNVNLGTLATFTINFGKDKFVYETGDGLTDITLLDINDAYFSFGIGGWASMIGSGLLGLLGWALPKNELEDIVKIAYKAWANIWDPIQYQIIRGVGHFDGAGAYLLGLQNNFYVNKNVTEISANTFGPDKTAEIVYYGSQSEWNRIKINEGNTWKSIRYLNL